MKREEILDAASAPTKQRVKCFSTFVEKKRLF
jgi:hypothetical protein